ncbi:Phosphatidylglycerophosphatase C [Marinomonas spartinae]|uniref:HAD-IB family phosphatase n=1 Tax=Marinomonas spartinae TaxID=1792290 RepID=UPI000808AA02|nr:HAD-IB family phosphatase [Marinomonas spartinae]SBS27161.1 Phosphatidylglycerophosphatase C [Marinomonas spartinae]
MKNFPETEQPILTSEFAEVYDIVFDFDGTLFSHDSFFEFMKFVLRKSKIRTLTAYLLAPLLVCLVIFRYRLKYIGSMLLWIGTVGLTDRQIDRYADEFVSRLIDGHHGHFYRDGLTLLRDAISSERRVMILTASGRFLIKKILINEGLHVDLGASKVSRRLGGLICDFHCYGENKVRFLIENGIEQKFDEFYSDSSADLPLFRLAKRSFIINGTARTKAKIERALKQSVCLINWN